MDSQPGPAAERYQIRATAGSRRRAAGQQADVTGDAGRDFVARVLGSTERVWDAEFQQDGPAISAAHASCSSPGFVQSACGMAQSAMGPFYCPRDNKVYIDLSFYQDMKNKLGAPGDFAQAYVIAHEVGHHVQNVLGIADKVTKARMQAPEAEANAAVGAHGVAGRLFCRHLGQQGE